MAIQVTKSLPKDHHSSNDQNRITEDFETTLVKKNIKETDVPLMLNSSLCILKDNPALFLQIYYKFVLNEKN